MTKTINYTENTELWTMEAIAENNGYIKTADCYWTQIFENANGDRIYTVRENAVTVDPIEAMKEATTEATEEATTEAKTAAIAHILDQHSIPYRIENGHILADSMEAFTPLFSKTEDLTHYTKRQVFAWLGY